MIGSPNYIFMVYDANQSTFTGARLRFRPARRTSRQRSSRSTRWRTCRTTTPSSPAAATIRRSSRTASRRAACSLVPRNRRPPRRRRSGVAPRAPSSIPATTRRATPSPTTTTPRSTSTSDAVAFAVLQYSYSTESVNGVPGVPVPGKLHGAGAGRPRGHVRLTDVRSLTAARVPAAIPAAGTVACGPGATGKIDRCLPRSSSSSTVTT